MSVSSSGPQISITNLERIAFRGPQLTCCQDSATRVVRRAAHDVRSGVLHTQAHRGRTRRNDDDPQHLHRTEREDGEPLLVFEGEPDHEHYGLADVPGEQVERERLDVVERAAALADGGDYGGEIVVGQHDVCENMSETKQNMKEVSVSIPDAFLATSEPLPIPMPTSARDRLGLSFTPSPAIKSQREEGDVRNKTYVSQKIHSLIAANLFLLCRASIILTFVSGEHRPITLGSSSISSTSLSESLSNSDAVTTVCLGMRATSVSSMIPISFAIAVAVLGWSPVSMCTTMPARRQSSTARRDSGP